MKTTYWTKIKEFHGVQLLRDPESLQSRITPIERPQPQQKPEPQISPEMRARAEASWESYLAGTRLPSPVKAEVKPMTFEERVQHEWRHSPSLRKEFVTFGSYQAFKSAEKAGRTRVCGVS